MGLCVWQACRLFVCCRPMHDRPLVPAWHSYLPSSLVVSCLMPRDQVSDRPVTVCTAKNLNSTVLYKKICLVIINHSSYNCYCLREGLYKILGLRGFEAGSLVARQSWESCHGFESGVVKDSVHCAIQKILHGTLSKKLSKFSRYNMKCRGKRDTTWNIPRVVSRFPRYTFHVTVYCISRKIDYFVTTGGATNNNKFEFV